VFYLDSDEKEVYFADDDVFQVVSRSRGTNPVVTGRPWREGRCDQIRENVRERLGGAWSISISFTLSSFL